MLNEDEFRRRLDKIAAIVKTCEDRYAYLKIKGNMDAAERYRRDAQAFRQSYLIMGGDQDQLFSKCQN